MTLKSDNEDAGEAQPSGQSDRVGYGKPPKEHQFQKGRSGNPLGRPRKAKVAKPYNSFGFSFGGQRAKQHLIQEAYRPVLVREGEQTIELPAIQAVFRAMGVAAMKGNRFAQRTMAELVQAVESQDLKLREDHLKAAIDYKCMCEEAIELARKSGRPEPMPLPHPDDIFINFQTGDAKVCGPITKEDKAEWDRMFDHLYRLQTDISQFAATFRKSRSETKRAHALERWMFEQNLFDRINDNLPRRYRKSLDDRCWEQGASLPGKQSRYLWPDED